MPRRPDPPDTETRDRWLHSSTRYCLLTGDWEQELLDWMALHLPEERLAAWGVPDMSGNAFKQACREKSVTYHQLPLVTHPDQAAAAPFLGDEGALAQTRHFLRMRRTQYLCEGMREILIHPHLDRAGRLRVRTVYPQNVWAWADPSAPDIPLMIWELRMRAVGKQAVYAWDRYDIRDPAAPTFQVIAPPGQLRDDQAEGVDITQDIFGDGTSFLGDGYWWRDAAGTPVLPYGLYHAEEHGGLFDAMHDRETVRGTLTAAMLNTYAVRGARDASGNVVLVTNGDVGALSTQTKQGAVKTIPMEAGSIHEINPKDPAKPTSITVIPPGADIEKLDAYARAYELRVAMRLGLKPADPTAQHGDPRSGYALALDRGSRRELQQQMEPMYRAGDTETLRLMAIVLNRGRPDQPPVPETGYQINYPRLPLSPDEEGERRTRLTWEMRMGIREPWEVILEYLPSLSETEARRRASLVNIEVLAALVGG